MQTNLDFLSSGREWPPAGELKRLEGYAANRRLFEGRHGEVYERRFARVKRDGGEHFLIPLNYFRLMTLKLGDLVAGTPPVISAGLLRGENNAPAPREDAVWDVVHNSGLGDVIIRAVYDMSRYGDAVLRVARSSAGGKGIVSLVRPDIWFPVVDENDIRRFTAHVLAWTASEPGLWGREKKVLKCEIHKPGTVEYRKYVLSNGRLGKLEASETTATGLPECAILPAQNCVTSDRVFGIDDYSSIDGIVSELETRLEQVAKVLDRHSEPSMQGPASALERTKNGEYRLKLGEYFINRLEGDETAGEVSYLTWDAKMSANFEFIEKLTGRLHVLSEMGSALLGDFELRTGQIPSGSALKRLLYAPLAKAARLRNELDAKLKKAVALCALYYGADMLDSWVTIRWADSLPQDMNELASIMQRRTGGAPTISAVTAIKALDGVDDEEAKAEIERMKAEMKGGNPDG